MGEDRAASEVEAAIREAAGSLLTDARLFDVYRGKPLEATERSLAYRLRFESPDRTLTEAEVDAAVAAIVEVLTNRLGARIRG
jgi:phenylalanyl-tRNA synthetase beta chain